MTALSQMQWAASNGYLSRVGNVDRGAKAQYTEVPFHTRLAVAAPLF
jgi:hypothetical protein